MKTSIVMTTYRRTHFLQAVLGSIARQDLRRLDYELLVINDGPQDETEWVATESDAAKALNIRYIHTGKRNNQDWRTMGFAANIGIQQAVGEIVVLTNSDMFHVGTTVAPIIRAATRDPMVISTVGRVFDDDGTLIDSLATPSSFSKYDPKRTRIIRRIRMLAGAPGLQPVNPDMPFFMAIRRQHLLDIGGYDEDFIGCAADDNDLMERLILLGCRYHYGPKSCQLIHLFHGRRTLPQLQADPGYQYNVDIWNNKRGQLVRNQGREWGRLVEDTEPYEDSPIHMVLWVTSLCSLDCPLCNQAATRHLDPTYSMDLAELTCILDSCVCRGIHFSTIELTGGEPTLWPIFNEAIDLIKKSGICDLVTFITNGRDPQATVETAKRHGVRYTVSTFQADSTDVEYHRKHGVAVMWNEHAHSVVPDEPLPDTIPAICSQTHDRQGQSVQQLLYYQGDVYYCCNAITNAAIVEGDSGLKCSFDDDFAAFFRGRDFTKSICSVCLCNRKVVVTQDDHTSL